MFDEKWIWRGLSGRTYAFVYGPALIPPTGAAVFILASHSDGMPRALFVGEAPNVAAAMEGASPLLAAALKTGLTHIHILELADQAARTAARNDLVHGLAPIFNAAAARVLPPDTAVAAPNPTERGWGMALLTGQRTVLPTRH